MFGRWVFRDILWKIVDWKRLSKLFESMNQEGEYSDIDEVDY